MLALERKNRILEKLQEEGRVVVSQLSGQFGVSEETIRRDLEKLETEGFATKSYGGAVLREDGAADAPFGIRKKKNVAQKRAIARLASQLVQDGDRIMLDASSTATYIARALKGKKRLTVITNSVEILAELADTSGWTVISTGGVLEEGYLALLGPGAETAFGNFWADKAFFSCKALDKTQGIMDARETFAHVKQVMTASARESILAVDQTKFDRKAFARITGIRNLTTVITDEEPSRDWQRIFRQKDIRCMYPEAALKAAVPEIHGNK